MQHDTDLSVCVVTRNRSEAITGFLRSLYETADHVSIDAIVVDNSSEDDTRKLVATEFPDVKLYENQKIEPRTRALNRALQIAASRYVSVWDEDVRFQPDSLQRLLCFMDDTPDVGIAGPKILDEQKLIEPSARTFPTLSSVLFMHAGLADIWHNPPWLKKHLMAYWNHETTKEVDWLIGSALIIRREVVNEIGLFDERFRDIYADADYCRRAKKAAWHNYYVHSAPVVHERSSRYHPYLAAYKTDDSNPSEHPMWAGMQFLMKKWLW